MLGKISLLIVILIIGVHSQNYTLVRHTLRNGGACLDGSKPGLYYHQGKGANKNKFIMYFDSGGFCGGKSLSQTLQSCYQRSFSSLGSTLNYPQSKNFDMGLLSTKQQDNPIFYDWTKVFVIYCDGSQHQGSRQDPIQYKDKALYFRGNQNTMQHFRFMDQMFDFYNGDTIVITGVSAGGIATYLWSNYLYQNTKSSKVYAIPDSGLFITDYYSPIAGQKIIRSRAENLFKLVDSAKGFPIPQCLEDFEGDIVQCFNAANIAKYLKAPMFIVQSPYDQWALNNAIGLNCLTNKKQPYSIQNCDSKSCAAIDDYRNLTLEALKTLKGKRKDVGMWVPACVQHGFSDSSSFLNEKYKVPGQNGINLSDAIKQFLNDPLNAKIHLDQVQWPNNKGCNGLNGLIRRQFQSQ